MIKKFKQKKLIIEGVTEEGKKFRPADWADRISGELSQFTGHRIRYDERLRPLTNSNEDRCLLMDESLKTSHPELYESILDFAKKNNLRFCTKEEVSSTEEEVSSTEKILEETSDTKEILNKKG